MGNIDPDMQPILDDLSARIAALEAKVNAPVNASVPASLILDVEKMKRLIRDSSALGIVAFADPTQPEPETPAVALPEGYRRVGDYRRAHGNSANWTLDELIQTQWLGPDRRRTRRRTRGSHQDEVDYRNWT